MTSGTPSPGRGFPLGGSPPVPPGEPQESYRHVVVGALAALSGLLAVGASFLSWRVYGREPGPTASETGWETIHGGLGRGPVALALGLALVCVGAVLAVGYRPRWVRVCGVMVSVGLMGLVVGEWAAWSARVPSAPGVGLWLVLAGAFGGVLALAAHDPAEARA